MSDNKRIMYIDDNKDHLIIVQAMLKRIGYTCETYSSAQQGLEVALAENFDLILLDIQMPNISGIELLKQLKTRRDEIGFRIVAITADSTVFSHKNPVELGFDAYLSKPVMPADLNRLISQMFPATIE